MNIQAEKLKLIEWITQIRDSNIIEKLNDFKIHSSKKTDGWNEISESEKDSINRGLEDVKNGRVISHSEAKKLYEKYL